MKVFVTLMNINLQLSSNKNTKIKTKTSKVTSRNIFWIFSMTKISGKKIDSTKVLALLCWACYKSKHTCNREERKLSNYTHERYLEWANQSSSNKVLGLAHFMKHNLNWVFLCFLFKGFWKNSHLKKMTATFLLRCQNSLQ